MQKLVEIVRTVVTEPDVLDDVRGLVEKLDKTPVVCGDKAGFIANTLLFGYLNHAVSMFEGRYATREDIDASMRLGCGHPMGPLALLDLIGLDSGYEICEALWRQFRDDQDAPAPLLKQYVAAANDGLKVLTALTALTLPATLIGTWYGMNFQHMPELKSPLGYPLAFAATILLTAGMWWWCKRNFFSNGKKR